MRTDKSYTNHVGHEDELATEDTKVTMTGHCVLCDLCGEFVSVVFVAA